MILGKMFMNLVLLIKICYIGNIYSNKIIFVLLSNFLIKKKKNMIILWFIAYKYIHSILFDKCKEPTY